MSKRKVSVEDKIYAVNLYLDGKESQRRIADMFDVSLASVQQWIRNYESMGANAFTLKGNKKYFKELNEAVKGKDVKDENGNTYTGEEAIAETVVKNFICQYYTWTNKDGNYDIGGMQYIYSPKQSDFETYTLYNFYKDMDLYLSKDGRSSLIEVKKVTINNVSRVDDYTVTYTDENGDEQSAGLPCVNVEASWEYDSDTKMNASEIQTSATFHVVNNNDRWEIGGIE